jgi:hypothetical protein
MGVFNKKKVQVKILPASPLGTFKEALPVNSPELADRIQSRSRDIRSLGELPE